MFNNTCAHDCGQPCLHCTSTAYCGYHTKSLNTDGMHSSKLTVINVEFSVPRVVTSTLRDQRSFTVTTETSWRNLALNRPPIPQTTHTCDQSSVGVFVQTSRHTKRMRQTEGAERLFVHPFTPKRKDRRPVTQHLRTSLHTNVWRLMIVVVWAQRRATRACHDMHFQLKSGDLLITLKHKNW